MSPDFVFALTLLIKMGVTAAFVVIASMVAERAGPLIGAMVSTLPISAGPAYAFLSLDHDSAFVAQSVLTSLPVNAATGVYALIYAALAQRLRLILSLPIALGSWFVLAIAIEHVNWTLVGALAFNVAAFLICVPLAHRFQFARMPLALRRWYDAPLRAAVVACLVATVVGLSGRIGPAVTGVLAVFPIVLTSLILILHPRIGGPATAAVIANTQWGLAGFSAALATLQITVVPLGAAGALAVALLVSIGWNVTTWFLRRRGHPAVR